RPSVPDAHRFVFGPTGCMDAVWTERHAGDPRCMAKQGKCLPARSDVPEPHAPIIAARNQMLPIGTEGHAGHSLSVTLQGEQLLAGSHVPKFDGLVGTARGEELLIRAESHGCNRSCVAAQARLFPLVLPPQMMPFPATQVFLIRPLRDEAAQELNHAGRLL